MVAAPVDSTRGYSGIPIAEDAVSCYEGLSSGNWVEGGLGAVATAADIADTIANPFGALFAAGAGWLMEHFEPLRQALDWLAGKPDVIASYGQTWDNLSKELEKIRTDHDKLVGTDISGWTGAAADAYRDTTAQVSDALTSASSVAGGLSTATTIMGGLVAAVRTTVRDLIARLVGNAVQWLLEEAFTLGLATPVVVGQITTAVSNAMAKVTKLISKVTTTIKKVTPLLEKLKSLFAKIAEKLKGLRRSGEPHTGTPKELPHTKADAPSTHTNPSKTVDDPHGASQSADRPFCKDDPIDVVTGEVVLSQQDLSLPGLLALTIDRHHMSNYRSGSLFGPSWASTLDQHVEVGPDYVWLATDDGRILRYPKPSADQQVLPDFGPRMPLERTADGYAVTHPQRGLRWEFVHVGPYWEARSKLPLRVIRRHAGSEIVIDYNPDGLPMRIRHSGGYDIAVDTVGGHVTALRLASAGGSDNVTLMRYRYDDSGQLSEVTNSSGAALRFTYDGSKLMSWTDRNGVWYRYVYDSRGRATSTIGSGGALNGSFEYQDRKTVHTDTLGNVTIYEMNELGQVIRETNAKGAITTREWDRFDRLIGVTDPLGHKTRYTYDGSGNVTAVVRPDNTTVTVSYTEHSLPAVTTDPAGGQWIREFDAHGNLIAETDPAGAATHFQYESGHIRAITDPLGNTTRFETNAAGLITKVTDPLGATTHHRRDQFGRVSATVDPLGGLRRYSWTIEGKLLSRTDADGATEQWRYDGEGNQIEHIDALGQSRQWEFTHFDLPSARVTADGARTAYVYDTELRLVEVVGPHGLRWSFGYDAVGNLVRETDFDGRVLTFGYDAAGRLTSRTNGLGETVTFSRDVHGSVVAKRTPDGITSYDRSPNGWVVRATGPDVEVLIERDGRGRVIAETVDGRTIRFTYDACGRRISRRTADGLVSTWDYDAAGSPTALQVAGRTMTFDHDLFGRQVQQTLGEVTMAQTWTASGRLASQTIAARQPISLRTWRYRADGYLNATNDRQYTLDSQGRVTAVHGEGWFERYDYDPVGNITNTLLPGESIGPREYAGSRLHSAGRASFLYDQQGRILRRRHRTLSGQVRLWQYTWDAEDRLTSVVTPDGAQWCYRYDPMGRRIAKQRVAADGTVLEQTDFTWDGSRLAEQRHSAGGTMTWEYRPGTVTPIAQVDRHSPQEEVDQRFYAIVTDLVGMPTELVDDVGGIAWQRTSTLWGRTLAQSGEAACPLRFPGQYHDPETDWNYNYLRYYDPETGRYASPDPLGLVPSINTAGYVPNPTRQIDPLGLQSCGVSGDEAKRQALADAGVPPGSAPLETRLEPSTTRGNKQVLDENHQPVFFPEEVYLNDRNELIVFQDHYTGHKFGAEGGVGDQPPHVHVRPFDDTRNGQVPGAQEHYYYDPNLGRPTPAE